ncbi:MAG: hypothetical protein QM690_02230 [Sphingobium sp.]
MAMADHRPSRRGACLLACALLMGVAAPARAGIIEQDGPGEATAIVEDISASGDAGAGLLLPAAPPVFPVTTVTGPGGTASGRPADIAPGTVSSSSGTNAARTLG